MKLESEREKDRRTTHRGHYVKLLYSDWFSKRWCFLAFSLSLWRIKRIVWRRGKLEEYSRSCTETTCIKPKMLTVLIDNIDSLFWEYYWIFIDINTLLSIYYVYVSMMSCEILDVDSEI